MSGSRIRSDHARTRLGSSSLKGNTPGCTLTERVVTTFKVPWVARQCSKSPMMYDPSGP